MFPKIVFFPPKSSILIGFSIINHPFWGTPIFGKHPNDLHIHSFCSFCHFPPLPPPRGSRTGVVFFGFRRKDLSVSRRKFHHRRGEAWIDWDSSGLPPSFTIFHPQHLGFFDSDMLDTGVISSHVFFLGGGRFENHVFFGGVWCLVSRKGMWW